MPQMKTSKFFKLRRLKLKEEKFNKIKNVERIKRAGKDRALIKNIISKMEFNEDNIFFRNLNIGKRKNEESWMTFLEFFLYMKKFFPEKITKDLANKFNNKIGLAKPREKQWINFVETIEHIVKMCEVTFVGQQAYTLTQILFNRFENVKIPEVSGAASSRGLRLGEAKKLFKISEFLNMENITEEIFGQPIAIGPMFHPVVNLNDLLNMKEELYKIFPRSVFKYAELEERWLRMDLYSSNLWISKLDAFLTNENNINQALEMPVKKVLKSLGLFEVVDTDKIPLDIKFADYQYFINNQILVEKEIRELIEVVQKIFPDNWVSAHAVNYFPMEIKEQVALIELLKKIISSHENNELNNKTYEEVIKLFPFIFFNHDKIPYPLIRFFSWQDPILYNGSRVELLLRISNYNFTFEPFQEIESESFNLINVISELNHAEYLSAEALYLASLNLLKIYFPTEWFISIKDLKQNFREETLFVTSYFEIEKIRKVLNNKRIIMENAENTIAELFSNFPGILFNLKTLPSWIGYTTVYQCFGNNNFTVGVKWHKISELWINESRNLKLQDFFWVQHERALNSGYYNMFLIGKWDVFDVLCNEINNFSGEKIINLQEAFEYWNEEGKKNDFYLSSKVLSQIRNESFDTGDVSLREYLIQLCGGRGYDGIFTGEITINNLDTTLISRANGESFFVKWNTFLKNYYQLSFKFGNDFLIKNLKFSDWISLSENEINWLNDHLAKFLDKIEANENRSYYNEFSNLFQNNVTSWLTKNPEEFKVSNHSLFIPKKTDFELEYRNMWKRLIEQYENIVFREAAKWVTVFDRTKMIKYIRNLHNEEYVAWFEAKQKLRNLLTREFSEFRLNRIFNGFSTNLLYLSEEELETTLSDYLKEIWGIRNAHSKEWEWEKKIVNTTEIEMLSDQPIYDATALEDCKEEVISLASKVISLLESKFKLPDCWIKSTQAIELKINKISNLEELKELASKYERQLDDLNKISRKTFYEQSGNSVELKSSNLEPFLVLENIPEIKDFSLEKTISEWYEYCEKYAVSLKNNNHFTTAQTISNGISKLISEVPGRFVPQITSENNKEDSYLIPRVVAGVGGIVLLSWGAIKIIEAIDLLKSKNFNPEVESRKLNVVLPMEEVSSSQVVDMRRPYSNPLLSHTDTDIMSTTSLLNDQEATQIILPQPKSKELLNSNSQKINPAVEDSCVMSVCQ